MEWVQGFTQHAPFARDLIGHPRDHYAQYQSPMKYTEALLIDSGNSGRREQLVQGDSSAQVLKALPCALWQTVGRVLQQMHCYE